MDFSEVSNLFEGKSIGEVHEGVVDRQWIDKKKLFKPVLGSNLTYVVAAVLFNEEGHVLLTQEGFNPHWGHWYLPAGRVDPGETLADAAKREVREETGIEFEPTALIAVESPRGSWFRFTFTGHITGGKLRTLSEQDTETLQGAYWPVDTVMGAERNVGDPTRNFILRGADILKLITLGVNYSKPDVKPHLSMLPCNTAHRNMLIRPLIICYPQSENSGDIYVLSMKKENPAKSVKLPLLQYDPRLISGVGACMSFYKEVEKDKHGSAQVCGILGVEHNGETSKVTGAGNFTDGLLLTVLVKIPTTGKSVSSVSENCAWIHVTNPELREKILKMYNATDACAPVPFMFR